MLIFELDLGVVLHSLPTCTNFFQRKFVFLGIERVRIEFASSPVKI